MNPVDAICYCLGKMAVYKDTIHMDDDKDSLGVKKNVEKFEKLVIKRNLRYQEEHPNAMNDEQSTNTNPLELQETIENIEQSGWDEEDDWGDQNDIEVEEMINDQDGHQNQENKSEELNLDLDDAWPEEEEQEESIEEEKEEKEEKDDQNDEKSQTQETNFNPDDMDLDLNDDWPQAEEEIEIEEKEDEIEKNDWDNDDDLDLDLL